MSGNEPTPEPSSSALSSSAPSSVLVRKNAVIDTSSPLVFVHPKLAAKLEAKQKQSKPRAAKTSSSSVVDTDGNPLPPSKRTRKTTTRTESSSSFSSACVTVSQNVDETFVTEAVIRQQSKFEQVCEALRVQFERRKAAFIPWDTAVFDRKSLFEFARFIAAGSDPMSSSWSQLFESCLDELRHSCTMVQMTLFYPNTHRVFDAFRLCPLDKVRVVIMGQDPYPQLSHTTCRPYGCGLSFSVAEDESSIPKSLQTVFEEMYNTAHDSNFSDAYFGIPYFDKSEEAVTRRPNIRNGDLRHWCDQGVLLLNAALTVAPSTPDTHRSVWTGFVVSVMRRVVQENPDTVFCFWGSRAFALSEYLSSAIVQFACAHPSPRSKKQQLEDGAASSATAAASSELSADIPFLGSRHFARVNQVLMRKGQAPILWHRPWDTLRQASDV